MSYLEDSLNASSKKPVNGTPKKLHSKLSSPQFKPSTSDSYVSQFKRRSFSPSKVMISYTSGVESDGNQFPVYFEVIRKHEEQLKNIFQFYTNFLNVKYEVTELSSVKFYKLVKDCKLVSPEKSKESGITRGVVFIIYFQTTKYNSTFRMNFDEFVNSLCLLSAKRYSERNSEISTIFDLLQNETRVSQYLEKLLTDYILPFAKQSDPEPPLDELSDPEVILFMSKHERSLYKIFSHYASYKRTPSEYANWSSYLRGLNTINIEEFYALTKDFEIFPSFASKSKMNSLFKASIANDHPSSSEISKSVSIAGSISGSNTANGSTLPLNDKLSLDFYGFLQCLVRISILRYSEQPLCNQYTTIIQKIGALLDHMNMSKGRLKFVNEIGVRNFLFKRMYNSGKQKRKMLPLQWRNVGKKRKNVRFLHLEYSTYANRKEKMIDPVLSGSGEIMSAGLEPEETHCEERLSEEVSAPNSSTLSSESTKDSGGPMTSIDDVGLYVLDHSNQTHNWIYQTCGTVQITGDVDPDSSIPVNYYLNFKDSETGDDYSMELNQRTVPQIAEHQQMHIWWRSYGSDVNCVNPMNDDHISIPSSQFDGSYALRFPTIDKCIEFGLFYNEILQGEKKGIQENSRRNSLDLEAMRLGDTSMNDGSIITKSMLETSDKLFKPEKEDADQEKNEVEKTNLAYKFREGHTFSNTSSTVFSDVAIEDRKNGDEAQTGHKEISHSANIVEYDMMKRIENVMQEFIQDYITKISKKDINAISDTQLMEDLRVRIQWISGLQFAGIIDNFFDHKEKGDDSESQGMNHSEKLSMDPCEIFISRRKEEVMNALVQMERVLCNPIASISKYYDMILQCLPCESTCYIEAACHDSLGVQVVCLNNTHLVVIQDDEINIKLSIFGNLFEYANVRDVVKVKASTKTKNLGKQHLNFDEERMCSNITVKISLSSSGVLKNLDTDTLNMIRGLMVVPEWPKDQCLPCSMLELVISLNFTLRNGSPKELDFPLSFLVVKDQEQLDRLYGPLKKHILNNLGDVPVHFKSLGLFSLRRVCKIK